MTLLALATAAVVVGSWRFTLSLGLRRGVDVVTAWLVVLAAEICLLVLGVGLAGQLRPVPLAVTAGVVSAAQVGWSLTGGREPARRSGRPVWTALGRALRRAHRHPILLVLALLVAAQYLWRLAVALRFPVLDYDGNAYHLISVDTWVQREAVTRTPQVVFADVYPQNSELITAWSATFLHSTWLSGLTQFLFVAMGTAAVVGIAANAGATRPRALLAGLVFAATPIVFLQAGTGYVDVAASATVLATWQLLLSAHDLRHRAGTGPGAGQRPERAGRHRAGYPQLVRYFLVAGLGVGMMLGTKSSNVLAAVLATGLAVVILRTAWRPPRTSGASAPTEPSPTEASPTEADPAAPDPPEPARIEPAPPRFRRWAAAPLYALLAPAVLVGGYWYLRNLLSYGNPLWPVTVPFFQGQGSVQELIVGGGNVPAEIAEDPPLTQIGQSWASDLFPHPFTYDQRLGGFGPQWLLLLAPAIAVMVPGFLRDRVGYLLGLVVPFGVLFLLQPAAWWSRYTIFVAGLGAVCYVLAVQWLAGRWERALHVTLVALVGIGMWWSVSPTYLAADQSDPLSPAEAVALLRADEKTRMTSRFPWNGYTALADAPRGALVAVPDRGRLLFAHPYVGTHLDRRLVVIPTPTDIGGLYAAARRVGADYVVLDPGAEPTAGLARGALDPASGFRQVGRTYDGLLFAVDDSPDAVTVGN